MTTNSSGALRIAFVHNGPTRFVCQDLEILSERYAVNEVHLRSPRGLVRADLARAIRRSDVVFGWFASWHTLPAVALARLFRKPSVLVIGGYDLACMPDIGYGHQRGGMKRHTSRLAM